MDIANVNKDLYWNMDIPSVTQASAEDDIEIVFEDNKSTENDIEVVLEVKNYSTKESIQESAKINVVKNIGLFLGLSCTQIFNDECILIGSSLLKWLKEWFPNMDLEFLKGISESQAVRNCQTSLTDLYNSISTGPLGDHSISTESDTTNDASSILSGGGITSKFPYVRCRLSPDSLVSEQQRQNTFESARLSDMLLDNLYRYAENFYLKRYHIRNVCSTTCNCNHPPLSETHSIERIDFIVHSKLFREYEEEKTNFRNFKIPINEKLLFHGTHATNLNKILDDNFKLSADPVSRQKLNVYGKGIYFSDFPGQSLKYGEALLLCKVILGREEVIQLGNKPSTSDEHFRNNYESRKMVERIDKNDAPAKIYMVPKPQQILPCYVIYLKKKVRESPNDANNLKISIGLPMLNTQPKPITIITKAAVSGTSLSGSNFEGPLFYVPSLSTVMPLDPHISQVGNRMRAITSGYDPIKVPFEWRFLLGIYIQHIVLEYLEKDAELSRNVDSSKLQMSQFLEILGKLCRERIPSKYLKLYYTGIATLRSLITKESFHESMNSFLKSSNAKDDSKQTAITPNFNSSMQFGTTWLNTINPSNYANKSGKRKHSPTNDSHIEVKRIYEEKLSRFGIQLDTYSDSSVCTICYSMLEKYDSLKTDNKRQRASPNSKKTVTIEDAESTFETKGCKHSFHLDCAKHMILNQPSDTYFECPVCKAIQGVKMGNQPESGEMKITKEVFNLPGYTKSWTLKKEDTNVQKYTTKFESGKGTMVVEYKFTNGTQTSNHPSPGDPYYAHMFPRKAYFPATPEGIKIVGMLRVAFDRRLVFTVGRSATTGRENVITWNGIHHKTKIADSAYGYPDPNYLQRVGDELKALGITPSDLQTTGSIIKI